MIENKQAKNKDVHMVIYYLEVDFLWKFCVQPKIVTKKTELNDVYVDFIILYKSTFADTFLSITLLAGNPKN